MTLNPAYLVLGNLILADSLFVAFTVLWFASLLWILKKATWVPLVLQLLFLYWAFELRYNALFYPAVAVLIFVFAHKAKLHYRLAGIALTIFIIAAAHNAEVKATERVTNTPVFSGFSGWMMANNALMIYKHAKIDTTDFYSPELQMLNRVVRRYIDSISPQERKDLAENKLGWSYLWEKKGPLRLYVTYHSKKYKMPYFVAWYQVSPLYYEYGKTIILNHPSVYMRHFILPNLAYFFMPRKIEMERYLRDDVHTVPDVTQKWFGFKNDKIVSRYPMIQKIITDATAPVFTLIMAGSVLFPLLFILRLRRQNRRTEGFMSSWCFYGRFSWASTLHSACLPVL